MRRINAYLGIVCGFLVYGCTSGSESSAPAAKQPVSSNDATAGTLTASSGGISLAPISLVELDEDSFKSIPLNIATTTIGSIRIDIMEHPKHGEVLVDEASKSVKYTPDQNYSGRDNFAVRVTEGTNQSAARSVPIKVNPIDDSPICLPQTFGAKTASEIRSTIVCQDMDSTSMRYAISTAPTRGSVTLSGSNFVYTLKSGQVDDDQFAVTATADGKTSKPALIKILPGLVGDKPVANNITVNCIEDELCASRLGGSSNIPEQGFHFEITRQPRSFSTFLDISNGDLTLSLPENWNGSDSFSYRVRSGDKWSDDVAVPIVVAAVNDLPLMTVSSSQALSVTTDEDVPKALTFEISDVDTGANDLEVVVNQTPEHGTVEIKLEERQLIYKPSENYNGADRFSVHVCEKNASPAFCSVPVTLAVSVIAVNDAPVALSPSLAITEDSPDRHCFEKTQLASDIDNAISDLVITPSNQSPLIIEASRICYLAPANFSGEASLNYQVRDPDGSVADGVINVSVAGVEDPTVFDQSSLVCNIEEDTTRSCTVVATDADAVNGAVNYELNADSVAALRNKGWLVQDTAFASNGIIGLTPPKNFLAKKVYR